ncbi:response regulator [Caldalkalibacillus mannanilyticus]|uniref:response regulator n=1 Tax=Caldalkalibacillus mannanilyticus TaxID=1418 RepID=UPI000468671A|nr:response regulator [Caldalkalibacillus mannanilyticus]
MEKKKILIVDDQYGIRVLLDEVFRKEGYTTFQAANGTQALTIAQNEEPDLVILDMKIPGMDGLEILKRIKLLNQTIQVIMITAYGELDLIQEAMRLGALTHFTKPFDIDELRKGVESYLTPTQMS